MIILGPDARPALFVVPGGISVRTNDLPFAQDSTGIPAAAGARPAAHSVRGYGSLRITWDARPPRVILAGDIDLTTHAALIASLALAKAADGAGQVHIDMGGVNFCDVAGLRIILRGGDGQLPASAPAVLHNLPPHLGKLLRLINRTKHRTW
jgi:anti-anti-sigma regulatory factor